VGVALVTRYASY